jgi:PmbA protein
MSSDRREAAFRHAMDSARAAGADDVETSYAGTETQFVRFASSRFTQVGSTVGDALRIRVLAGGRLGTQVCATLDAEQVAAAARGAVAAARLTPPLDVPFAFAVPAEDADGRDVAVTDAPADAPPVPEELTAANAPAALGACFERARDDGVEFAGSLKVRRRVLAVRTAAGVRRDFANAVANAQLIGIVGDSSGYAGASGAASAPIDFDALAEIAADKALRGRKPIDLQPGAYDVVLAPEAIAELIEWMAMASFGGKSLLEETSLLTGRRGDTLCDAAVTIREQIDASEAPFDAEGVSRQPVTFIDAGKGGRVVTDAITAARLADPRGSTGHAPPLGEEEEFGPMPVHVRLLPGQKSEEELIAGVDRGIYVTRFHYVNGLLDTRRATTTGMTRDGTFLIEGGKLGRGIHNLRFTEHMLEAFTRHGGLGRDARDVPTWWSDVGTITTPAVLIREFHFTGKSR